MALADRARMWANEPVMKTVGTLAAVWTVLLVMEAEPWSIDDFCTLLTQVRGRVASAVTPMTLCYMSPNSRVGAP